MFLLDLDFWFRILSTFDMLCHFTLASMVSDEKSAVSQIVFSFVNKMLFLPVLCIFRFQKRVRDVSWQGFLCFYILKVSQLLDSVGLSLLLNQKNFQPLFLYILCQPFPLSPLLLGL